jgi:hypothetical protein
MPNFGLDETKDVLNFLAEFGENLSTALDDGDVDWGDLINFIPALAKAGPAWMGIEKVPGEITDMTPEEKAELDLYVMEEFDISEDNVEDYLERGFAVLTHLFEFVSTFYIDNEDEESGAQFAADVQSM